MDGMIELPFALPTAVCWYYIIKMYAEDGMIGRYFTHLGLRFLIQGSDFLIALVFIGIPFIVRAVQPVLEKMDDQYEEAAYMLGATPTRTFFKVILPELRPTLLTGFGLHLQGDRGIRKCDLYLRKQCQGTYTDDLLCDHAEI